MAATPWIITKDGITYQTGYASESAAKFAAGVELQRAPVGTRIAVTKDYETGTAYDVCFTPERGEHIVVRQIIGRVCDRSPRVAQPADSAPAAD